jgi:hypothetical protein
MVWGAYSAQGAGESMTPPFDEIRWLADRAIESSGDHYQHAVAFERASRAPDDTAARCAIQERSQADDYRRVAAVVHRWLDRIAQENPANPETPIP